MDPISYAKAVSAENKVKQLANKTVVTLNHQFTDTTARDDYFTANPTELVDNLFIKVGAGYQQYLGAWEDVSPVLTEAVTAEDQPITDAGDYYTATNTEDALQEIASVVASHKNDYATYKDSNNLKVAKVEKDLNDYQKTLSQVNVNQEAKQKATGYGIVSLPKNAANGQVSVSVKGNTRTNLVPLFQHWQQGTISNTGVNISDANLVRTPMIKVQSGENLTFSVNPNSYIARWIAEYDVNEIFIKRTQVFTHQNKVLLDINTKNVRVVCGKYVDGTSLSTTTSDLLQVQPLLEYGTEVKSYISSGTKSTVSASRLKSVGKNLFDYKMVKNRSSDVPPIIVTNDYVEHNGSYHFTIMDSANNIIKTNDTITLSWKHQVISGNSTPMWRIRYTDGSYSNYTNSGGYVLVIKDIDVIMLYTTRSSDTAKVIYSNIQLEQGTVATPYEPYTESTQYLPNVGELRSLPNGTKDEVNVSEKKLYQRIGIKTEIAIDTVIDYADMAEGGEYFAWNEAGETETGIKGETLGIDNATLTYQLAEPIVTPIQVSGTLLSNPSGTVYVEPVVADAGIYDSGIIVLHQDLPIDYIERLSKVDFMTGLETELDVSQCVIAGDKVSFTHPSLVSGDIVFFTYLHNIEGTQGEMELEYYDSRHVLKDDVTGKFYKIVQTVTDGVLTDTLVEV